MKRVVITGAAGFIGSNLSYELVKQGYDVLGIDNLSTGIIENVRKERFKGLPGVFTFWRKSINAEDLYKDFLGAETVFHLAALPRVSFSIDHPIEADIANTHGTLSVLEAARKAGVKRVVFSCSSSIYGGVAEFPTPETAQASPKSPYALHKQTGAEYCRLYSELHGLETVSLLYFNVCGPKQRADSAYATVIPAFFDAAMNGKVCRIDGSGGQSRDFCYVDNVVQANILSANYTGKLMGDRFNIACGESHTVNEVFEQVEKLVGRKLEKVMAPARLGDPYKSLADISKARTVLGYDPKIKFEEGMKLTANWWVKGVCNGI